MNNTIIIPSKPSQSNLRYIIPLFILVIAVFSSTGTLYFLLIVAVLFISVTYGIEIDAENQRLRSYYTFLWIKKGKWVSLTPYKVITIKKSKKGTNRYSGRSNVPLHLSAIYYEVFLSSKNFRKRQRLLLTKDKNEAAKLSKKWSYQLNVPLIKYSPKPIKREKSRHYNFQQDTQLKANRNY